MNRSCTEQHIHTQPILRGSVVTESVHLTIPLPQQKQADPGTSVLCMLDDAAAMHLVLEPHSPLHCQQAGLKPGM